MDLHFNEKLIEEVRKYGCIYDLSAADYRNVLKKDKIWAQIGVALNTKGKILYVCILEYIY